MLTNTKQLIGLAIPLIAALLAQISIDLIDTIMIGWLGPAALGAKVLAGEIYITAIVVGASIMNAVGITIAHHYGAKEPWKITATLQQGIYLALLIGLPIAVLMWFVPNFLAAIDQSPPIVALTQDYLHTLTFGFPAIMLFLTFRELLAASDKARAILWITLCALPINATLNYILMYGKLGFPRMGIAGVGTASALVEWLMLSAIFCYTFSHPRLKQHVRKTWHFINWPSLSELFRIGYPMGLMGGFEIGLFAITAIMMGYVNTTALAAHQIVLQIVGIGFMFFLGVSQATGIKVAYAMGMQHPRLARNFTHCAVVIGLFLAAITSFIFWRFPNELADIFVNINDPKNALLLHYTVTFFLIAIGFQFFDALQIISLGALRGMKDTFVPMLIGLGSYWVIGLSSGYLLAFPFNLAGAGLWWGLCIGIAASGIILLLRFKQQIKLQLNR